MNLYSSNLGKSFARKHIIAQLLCPVQRSLMQGSPTMILLNTFWRQ
jgi:hypothetical protein